MRAEIPKKTAVIGLGYIGLPTAALIAGLGGKVVGVDLCGEIVKSVNAGHVHFEEAGLDALVARVVARGDLRATRFMEEADVFLIAVPTPVGPGQVPDLGPVYAAARNIAPVLRPGNLVIVESTCPVGTTERLAALWAALRPDLRLPLPTGGAGDISIAYCPERVLPGRILTELVANDRCIGGLTPHCATKAARFYRQFVKGACTITTARVAEMVKLAENSFRDVNIAFANELSLTAEHLGVDIWEVISLANRHPRVDILRPGPGVGGHCIAVDPWFLIHSAPDQTRLMRTAREVNSAKARHVAAKAAQMIEAAPADAQVALLGLSFKADVGDLRESPALEIADHLASQYGPRLHIVEPHIAALPAPLAAKGGRLTPLNNALAACEILILLVDHQIFRAVPASVRRDKKIYDVRGIWLDALSHMSRSAAEDQLSSVAGGR